MKSKYAIITVLIGGGALLLVSIWLSQDSSEKRVISGLHEEDYTVIQHHATKGWLFGDSEHAWILRSTKGTALPLPEGAVESDPADYVFAYSIIARLLPDISNMPKAGKVYRLGMQHENVYLIRGAALSELYILVLDN